MVGTLLTSLAVFFQDELVFLLDLIFARNVVLTLADRTD